MNLINLKEYALSELNKEDSITLNGGHDGDAYKAGRMIGKAVGAAATFIGVMLLIFAPKA